VLTLPALIPAARTQTSNQYLLNTERCPDNRTYAIPNADSVSTNRSRRFMVRGAQNIHSGAKLTPPREGRTGLLRTGVV
jgi:hypothetical protein